MDSSIKVTSVSSFVDAILKKQEELKIQSNINQLWFRGEADNTWKTPLVPGSYRYLASNLEEPYDIEDIEYIKPIEKNIKAEFNRKSARYKIENNPWNKYFLIQHYGINTRLLDWTENALIALFFAIESRHAIQSDAVVWILQPFVLNHFTINKIMNRVVNGHIIPTPGIYHEKQDIYNIDNIGRLSELTRRYIDMDFADKIDYYPLSIYPSYFDNRMSAQKSCFTIFGNKINGLIHSESENRFLDSVIIDATSKLKIKRELKSLGIDYESAYPDLVGLGLAIMDNYRNEFEDGMELLRLTLKRDN